MGAGARHFRIAAGDQTASGIARLNSGQDAAHEIPADRTQLQQNASDPGNLVDGPPDQGIAFPDAACPIEHWLQAFLIAKRRSFAIG